MAALLVIIQPALADDKTYVIGSLKKLQAQQKKGDVLPQVLIKNGNVFDGKSDELFMGQDVLVEGNLIKEIGKGLKAGNGATVNNGELLQLTGVLNRYPKGLLGVIQEGAYANILLIDRNPIEDLLLLTNKDKISLIMKDGKIYKNTL